MVYFTMKAPDGGHESSCKHDDSWASDGQAREPRSLIRRNANTAAAVGVRSTEQLAFIDGESKPESQEA
ncbi:hypothetical protein [Hominifimenecus sp. rT4P-3]|uniref:hypothetical protein n=1 Tax=Hominifimenecus sp. rT4P-3 TaxID=3242979 RepID=UPI003DA4D349